MTTPQPPEPRPPPAPDQPAERARRCSDCRSPSEPGHTRCRRCLDSHAARSRGYVKRLKRQVLEAYGGAWCACCGETSLVMLSLDHINQDGSKFRRAGSSEHGHQFYHRLKREGFPPGFRVLCRNCNFAVYHAADRRCPHRTGCFAESPAEGKGSPAPAGPGAG